MDTSLKPLFPLSVTDLLLAFISGLLSLALYIRTLAPSLLYGDVAEFQTLSYTLGMTHASGYPTQIIIGKLFTFADSYTDYPQAATENAKIALRWAEENGWGDCGTPVGKARANQLANREPISRDTIARMAGFERHRQNSDKELGDGCGRLMWLAWGGDEGIAWAQRKLEQLKNG